MNKLLICTCFFSLLCSSFSAQIKDSTKIKDKKSPLKISSVMVGVDVANAGISAFGERKLFQGFVSARILPRYHAIVETGFDKNVYQKGGYDATASGGFLKLGALYQMSVDHDNPENGFFFGLKIAGSIYSQNYAAVPIKGALGQTAQFSMESFSGNAFWTEAHAGARIKLFTTPFYIDVNAGPRVLLYAKKQEEMRPMIIPGFGKSSGNFTFGVAWSIGYIF